MQPLYNWIVACKKQKETPSSRIGCDKRQFLVMLPVILLQIQPAFICLIRHTSPFPPPHLTSFSFLLLSLSVCPTSKYCRCKFKWVRCRQLSKVSAQTITSSSSFSHIWTAPLKLTLFHSIRQGGILAVNQRGALALPVLIWCIVCARYQTLTLCIHKM